MPLDRRTRRHHPMQLVQVVKLSMRALEIRRESLMSEKSLKGIACASWPPFLSIPASLMSRRCRYTT